MFGRISIFKSSNRGSNARNPISAMFMFAQIFSDFF